MSSLRSRINCLDFEYTLLGCTLLVLGALQQISLAMGASP